MNPELPVRRQLDAYNARDLDRFVAQYSDDVQLFRPPEPWPILDGKAAMAEHYATKRFNLPGLHAALVNRMVVGNKVVDHEHILWTRLTGVEGIAWHRRQAMERAAHEPGSVWAQSKTPTSRSALSDS